MRKRFFRKNSGMNILKIVVLLLIVSLFIGIKISERQEYEDYERLREEYSKIKAEEKTEEVADIQTDTATPTTIIDCWGDSLTEGTTNYSYPKKLQELLGGDFVVNNYGHGSETAESVAFRQGGLNAVVEPFTIGSDGTSVIEFKSVNGASLDTLNYGGKYTGNNYVYINGDKLMFRRTENSSGEIEYKVLLGTVGKVYNEPYQMIAEGEGINHIMIVCIGTNGWVDNDAEHLADIIQNMIDHNNYDKYLILGTPTGNSAGSANRDKIFSSRFGKHFVNTREYISAYALIDNGLTATEEDITAMNNGEIPPQVKADGIHLNEHGYNSMAKCVYESGKDLGYWN